MTAPIDEGLTPAFRAQLAWEISRAARREERFALGRPRRGGRLRVAAVVVGCLALGIASNFAAAQVRDGSRRDSLVAAVQADVALMTARLDVARAQLDSARRQVQAGATTPEESAAAEAELRALETRMAQLRSNLAEINATSLPPRDDLNAPRVGGRDYVAERAQLALAEAQQQLTTAERAEVEAARRVRVGVASDLARAEAELDATKAKADLSVLAARLTLRREFLEKGTAAEELAQRLDSTQTREDIAVAQQALALAQARVQVVRREHGSGTASDLDLMRAQVEVAERNVEVARLAARLRAVVRVGH